MGFTLLGILNSQAVEGSVDDLLSSAPLWLDAADASVIISSSGSVSQWNNKGTLENISQATAAEQPSTGIETLNGINVISFASGDNLNGSSTSAFNFLHNGTNYMLLIVAKHGDSSNPNGVDTILRTNNGSTGNVGVDFFMDDRDSSSRNMQLINFVTNGTGGLTAPVDGRIDSIFTPNTFQIFSAALDPDDAIAADRAEYFVNGGSGTKPNIQTGTVSSANYATPLKMAAFTIPMSVAEFIVLSGADATENNRQRVVNYLNTKWGIF